MQQSRVFQFIILLVALVFSIGSSSTNFAAAEPKNENVYTVTPTTVLAANLTYINTAEIRQKSKKYSTSYSDSGGEEEDVKLREQQQQLLGAFKSENNNDQSSSTTATFSPVGYQEPSSAQPGIYRMRKVERLVGGYLHHSSKGAESRTRLTTSSQSAPPPTSAPVPTTTTTLAPEPASVELIARRPKPQYFNIRQNSSTNKYQTINVSTDRYNNYNSGVRSKIPRPVYRPNLSSTSTTTTTVRPEATNSANKLNTKIYFKRKPISGSNSTRSHRKPIIKVAGVAPEKQTTKTTATKLEDDLRLNSDEQQNIQRPIRVELANNLKVKAPNYNYHSDSLEDAALLEIDSLHNGLDNWDNGLLRASAGAGAESSDKKPESKKTLSDQVAEGKYGLIQKELFEKPVERPGILSYAKNPEVPKDSEKNLGGLTEEDIWLAEDHLLVLKGGGLAHNENQNEWKPIDSYEAPKRPVKIPKNPKVPPPFPVQLDENGPVQFIGQNQVPFFHPFANESLLQYPGPFGPPPGNGFDPQNLPPRPGQNPNSQTDNGYQYPPPIPPWNYGNNETFANPFLNQGPPNFGPPPPGFGGPTRFPLNGSLENVNNTADYFDEDDPSLYYPPPYSFVYKSNYTNPVPPGPLVPGIVLPPPPNFFARLEPTTSSANRTATKKRPINRIPIVRPHKVNPVTPQITKLTTTNLPPTIRRPTITTQPTTTSTTTTTPLPILPVVTKQKVYIPHYKDQENVVVNYQPPVYDVPIKPPVIQVPVSKPIQPTTFKTVTQLKKVNEPLIKFVPQVRDPLPPKHASNPIYFEYFDAGKVQPNTNVSPEPNYIPLDQNDPNQQVYDYDYNKYVYITPKPEIRPNGIDHSSPSNDIVYDQVPLDPIQTFNHEIETIRQTIKYYQSQPQVIPISNENSGEENYPSQAPRTPKAKPVVQYAFDVTESNVLGEVSSTISPSTTPSYFKSKVTPSQIDTTPFKPMVQYSAPLGSQADKDGFKPFPPSTSNYYLPVSTPQSPVSSTTPRPHSKPTKTRSRLLPINKLPVSQAPDDIYNIEFTTTSNLQNPNAYRELQYLRNIRPYQNYDQQQYTGYYYDRPQENRDYYQQGPITDPYMKQIAALRQKLRQYPTQNSNYQEFYQHPNYHQLNNSSLKYQSTSRRQPRPNSQFVEHPSTTPSYNQYQNLLGQPRPTNAQYYSSRIQNLPQSQQQQQQQFVSLNNDIRVNYKYPLPAANPDSEFLSPEFLEQHNNQQQQANNQRPFQTPYFPSGQGQFPQQSPQNPYPGQVIQYRLPGDQAHVYFITPQDRKRRNFKRNGTV